MKNQFSINCEWADTIGSPPEVAATSAFLEIKVGDNWATKCDSDFSGSVSTRVLLSAYPLAMWLASSWWRLRWETSQLRPEPLIDWKMSHWLPAAGSGFIWPDLKFESDGESIQVLMHPSGSAIFEPIRFLGRFSLWIKASDFESAVNQFVDRVLTRLHERGLPHTQLRSLWDELAGELADPEVAEFRRIEAILGYDPGEADDGDVERFNSLRSSAGPAAAEEIAHASAGLQRPLPVEEWVRGIERVATKGCFDVSAQDLNLDSAFDRVQPWHKGYALASKLRLVLNGPAEPVSDKKLSKLLGMKVGDVRGGQVSDSSLPFGLALRALDGNGEARFFFRRPMHIGRRFEAARMLADHLLAPSSDAWLPTTGTRTARQKAQRAFAAEFLCPNQDLREFMGNDLSDDRIEDAANHFLVSEDTVRHQVNNHWN